MMWTATIWGQPISVNDIYEIVWRYSSTGRRYKGIGKKDTAVKYQDDATLQVRVAKPSGWIPSGQVRITIDAFLSNDIDCDNLSKILMDAIQSATGINDRMFLSCWRSKSIGNKQPRLVLEFSDAKAGVCHCRPNNGESD